MILLEIISADRELKWNPHWLDVSLPNHIIFPTSSINLAYPSHWINKPCSKDISFH